MTCYANSVYLSHQLHRVLAVLGVPKGANKMSITIDSANRISIDNIQTGLAVTQDGDGTIVYTPEGVISRYKEHKMPHTRYSLSHDRPFSGVAGKSQFENDIKKLIMQIS